MSNKDLISIIIPVYNIEGYLPKCLDTIARQTYSNLEIILVDDGSTDGSGHICDKFAEQDSRAVVFHHENNKQLWAARNTGQAAAHGEFIMFVDGDDYLHLDAIKTMHEAIIRDGGYDVAIINHKGTVTSDEDNETNSFGDCIPLNQDELMDGVFKRWRYIWNKLYRLNRINGIWAHEYERVQDFDYCIRTCLVLNRGVWIQKELYYYRQRDDSASHKTGAQIIGLKCYVDILYDNLRNLPLEKTRYQHYMLELLYVKMVQLISMTWNTKDRRKMIILCKLYDQRMSHIFCRDKCFSSIQKIALRTNIRYPYIVRFLKKVSFGRLSWSQMTPF